MSSLGGREISLIKDVVGPTAGAAAGTALVNASAAHVASHAAAAAAAGKVAICCKAAAVVVSAPALATVGFAALIGYGVSKLLDEL